MTDWEKLKVTDLKEELKSRGIPLTGLKLKQQFIDKLNEIESETRNGDDSIEQEETNIKQTLKTGDEEDPVRVPGSDAQPAVEASQGLEDPDKSPKPQDQDNVKESRLEAQPEEAEGPKHIEDNAQESVQNDTSAPARELAAEERVEQLPDEFPAELKKEESYARDGSTPPPFEAENAAENKIVKQDDPFVSQQAEDAQSDRMAIDEQTRMESSGHTDDEVTRKPHGQDQSNEEVHVPTDPASSKRVPSPDILDDQRKRKRRSATPVPESERVPYKRARTGSSTPPPTKRESDALQQMQENTNAAQAVRDLDKSGDADMKAMDESVNKEIAIEEEDDDQADNEQQAERSEPERERRTASQSHSHSLPERDISPSIHPATRSLYIRNFKRPLHIPTLRNHVASLAGSSSQDPLKVFYLDSVRTHAYVSFTSISAASRVRNAMHSTRFPDEPMREALWIDFIPDEKVQTWIDEETGGGSGGFGGGRSSKKYEIVYNDTDGGVEATLREASNFNSRGQRPDFQQSHSNRMVPQDRTASAAVASGIHPSRAPLVPMSPPTSRSRYTPRAQPPPRASDPGKGFRALDELFSSTTAKPKLYYKLPPQPVIEDRRDMIRGLRVGHDQRGKSGDEGMKRYTFEKDKRGDREEWVDKGPEFGFGRRGQERLTGFGSSYGGSRGRGGVRGAKRGGDSWRGR